MSTLNIKTEAQRAQSAQVAMVRAQSAKNQRAGLMSAHPKMVGKSQFKKENTKQQMHNNWMKDDDLSSDDDNMDIFGNHSKVNAKNISRNIRSAQSNARPNTASTAASKLNVKTLKNITNQQCFEITPTEIYFDNIEINQPYQTILYVQNLSKIPKKVRVYQPKTKKFWVDFDSSQSLAAGICGKLYINFETNVLEDFADEVEIEYEDEGKKQKIVVPIFAKKPHPTIIYQDFINMGFVRIHRDVQRTLVFENKGKMPGRVRLIFDHIKSIKMEPSVFVIQPQLSQQVKLTYNQKDSGIFRGQIEVQVDGKQNSGYIDISATCVDYNKMILDENNAQTSSFDFGEIYYGQSKQQIGYLYNNSPKPQKFKVQMKLGIFNPNDETVSLQTPADQGKEITDQIMSVFPSQGEIKPYSNVQLAFNCNSVVTFEHQVLARKYALSTNDIQMKAQEYQYSALFKFKDDDPKEEPIVVSLTVKGTYPLLKLSKQILKFGECNANDHRESLLDLENRHSKLPIDVVVERTPCFNIDPMQISLIPNQRSTVKVSFTPNNVGQFSKDIIFSLLNGLYQIPLKVTGQSQKFDQKKKKERGPECGIEDFQTKDQYLDAAINKNIYDKKMGVGKRTFQASTEVKLPKGLEGEKDVDINKLAEIQKDKENKKKYDGVLEQSRQSRIQKEKQKIIDLRYHQMFDKLKAKGLVDQPDDEVSIGPVDNKDQIVRGDPKIGAPVDLEFELGMMDPKIEPPMLDLPPSKDPLFVLKPIGDYDPIQDQIKKVFDPNPDAIIKKLLPEKAVDHKDVKGVHKELTGQELKCIQSGPTVIDFGEVYVNSRVQKTFSVKNDLRDAIRVQLKTNVPELRESFQRPQILKSSETARFAIVLFSEDVDEEFKARIQYTINYRHQYEFEIRAKITQVSLKLNKTQIKFAFQDNNNGMETSETVLVENNGNAPGHFKWDTSSKIFSIYPSEGDCPAKGNIPITITYRPSPGTSTRETGTRYEEDKLLLYVTNGMNQVLKCVGVVNEAKCVIKQSSMELNQVLVCKEEVRSFTVKNTSRIAAIYRILTEYLPENLIITSQTSGRIPSDGSIEVGVKYLCNTECKVESDIKILIRGGKILKLPFSVETIIPKVYIRESAFNFGKITALGNQGEKEMNLVNESAIEAYLVLDLRTEDENPDAPDGIDCLTIVSLDKLEESILKQVPIDYTDDNQDKHDQDDEDMSTLSDEDKHDMHNKVSKLYNITIKPQQTLRFKLTFQPKAVRDYEFEIPFTLQKYGKIDSLTRSVSCKGMKPKFLVDPQVVEFPRKIITSIEHQFPINSEIILSNPEKRSISWRLDTSILEKDKIFTIHPTQGRVDPGQTLRIKSSFNPSYPNNYEKLVPLYIDDPDIPADQPCCYITLKGVAAYPKLLFDRREVLMPVVPLNVESRCIFYIINDGYDNLKIKHKILEELGQIDIKCNFPNGILMGMTHTKLKVEIIFSSKKPISFTTKIEFKDNNSNSYIIPVSGTADNCLFTNFSFIQRNKGGYAIRSDSEKSALQILEEKDSDGEDDVSVEIQSKGTSNQIQKKRSSILSNQTISTRISIPSGQGYTLIPKDMIESSREFIRQWLNYYVLPNQIQSFPETIVDDNGDQLIELVNFCSGKSISNLKCDLQNGMKRAEKSILLFKQYDEIIRYLKAEGALLNHIRPQYLLSYNDYHSYIKQLPKEQNSHVAPQYLKIHPKIYQYIHFDCWINLFYQIIKCYYLAKVNSKIIKNIPNALPEKLTLPDFYINGSNIYSDKEGILIRWLELCSDVVLGNLISGNPGKRIRNLETDLQDGNVISYLLQNYVGTSCANLFNFMKPECASEEEVYQNCEKLAAAFQELKIQTQYNPIDLARPNAREILLFLIQLYSTLPFYIPKQAPLIFSCILGEDIVKTIEITNPTQKPISYWVKYEGSPDFSLESEDNFRVEPKGVYKYKIKFTSRVSNTQTGRITFTNKKESTTIASAIVFDLKSQITGRVSQQIWNVECSMYECKEFSIAVQNKFLNHEYGDFMVSIMHEYEIKKPEEKKEEEPKETKKKKTVSQTFQMSNNKKGKKKQSEEEDPLALPEVEKLNFPCFFCKTERVKLKRGATFNLQMAFIPIIYENQKCYVIFNDPKVGEFQHEIRGRVDMPEEIIEIPNDKLQISPVIVDNLTSWNIPLTFNNENLKNARKYLEQWLVEKPKFQKVAINPPTPQLTVKKIYQMLSPRILGYDVEIEQPPANAITVPKLIKLLNPHYKAPPAPTPLPQEAQAQSKNDNKLKSQKNAVNKDNKEKDEKKSQQSNNTEKNKVVSVDQSQSLDSNNMDSQQATSLSNVPAEPETNHLPLNFFFKNPFKDYISNIVIKNQQKTDVRRFKVVVTALPKAVKATLEMTAPARECVMQEIPIINNTEKDWQLKINLVQNNEQKYFFINQMPKDGQERPQSLRDFIVKRKTTGNIPVCFFPEWICNVEATLQIQNPLTQDQFDYSLKGIGEEPLAIDHIIITSQSRVTTQREIMLNNPTEQPITYIVETDLLGAAGQASITVPPKKKIPYILQIHPVMSGQYTGSITFTKADGTYIWWTVLLNTESPPADRIIDLATNIRKPLAFDIDLSNPTDDVVTFEVVFEGEGLLGDQFFNVYPKQMYKYELFYMPLKPGKQKGSVAFLSEKLGEIWYELNLQADDSGVVRLPILKCELGKIEQHEVILENPSNEDVKVKVKISNPQNFEVYPENIVIPSYDQISAYIKYRPSQLDKPQTSEVIFETENIGKWVYTLFGQGLPPTNFDTKIITIGLNKDYSSVLNFKNPFKDPVQVRIFIDTKDVKVLDVIKLLKRGKENYVIIPPLTVHQIPFSFTPKEIRFYDCDVVVAMNDKIQWRFPIHAITESLNSGVIQNFKTKCRVQTNQQFSLNLPGISDMFNKEDKYTFQIKDIPEEFKKLIDRSLKIKITKNTLNSPDDFLSFDVSFKPYKPFKCIVDFLVLRENGGLWKFKISLEATVPNEDDIIILSAPIGEKDSVSFKIMNRFKSFATFHSHFTQESDVEFSVTPMTGLLEPAGGKNPTQFIITFTPLEYGKVRQAKLIIETDEMYWSYVIKGVLPKYIPPQIQESRFNYKPNYSYLQELNRRSTEKKNFISTNIKNQSMISPSVKSVKTKFKNTSVSKGYFNYVPSLAGGEGDNQTVVSYVTSNYPNNAQKVFRVQPAKSVKSVKSIKSITKNESQFSNNN
ncbi:flagellar associated protein (macronuclear) [Tetrahymena thermophila SB210]|uniref:Flagellar associated protein n=1 Tax=Tetrahymena thermophila (strain SB210) TaxID=312017 RepID=I7MEN4_TETTS|nr:flagellar associated protein [Tetrahymena thermophila SB210]EAR97253.2 flagellar associated protein [Tetrahymena thermophila SB210]|eukprot:XP_001017498.2 flagellar associated protein [Tetrahymena thermophila SB210]